jgi:hypothetical protein
MKNTLSAMTEFLVVVICTIAFALAAVGILASVLGRGLMLASVLLAPRRGSWIRQCFYLHSCTASTLRAIS